jgi:hypothetical protein
MVAAPQPEPLRKRLFRYAGLVVSGIVVGALVTTLASADTFGNGSPTEGYISDSSVHTYCFGSGFNSDLEFHAQYAMGTSLDAATQMSDQFEACSSATDVRWLDANLPGGTRGQYICTNLGAVCFASDITLDPAESMWVRMTHRIARRPHATKSVTLLSVCSTGVPRRTA